MNMNCDMSCKDKVDLILKLVFVSVFTWGVMSAICCTKSSCGSKTQCGKAGQVAPVKQCGVDCQKACCKK